MESLVVLNSTAGKSSSYLIYLKSHTILVDCGYGTYQKLIELKYKINRIRCICITHLHHDHVGDLHQCLLSMESPKTVRIYGPIGLTGYIKCLFDISKSYPVQKYVVIELTTPSIPYQTDPHVFPLQSEPYKHIVSGPYEERPEFDCVLYLVPTTNTYDGMVYVSADKAMYDVVNSIVGAINVGECGDRILITGLDMKLHTKVYTAICDKRAGAMVDFINMMYYEHNNTKQYKASEYITEVDGVWELFFDQWLHMSAGYLYHNCPCFGYVFEFSGFKISIFGDNYLVPIVTLNLIRGSQILITECTKPDADIIKALWRGHSTSYNAIRNGKECKIILAGHVSLCVKDHEALETELQSYTRDCNIQIIASGDVFDFINRC